jgi:hypothetical protein
MNTDTRFAIYAALAVLLAAALGAGWVTEANLDVALRWLAAASVAGFVLAAKNTKP